MGADDKKIFGVLKDPGAMIEQRDKDQNDINTHLFPVRYQKNGSKEMVESDLDYALYHFVQNHPETGSGFQRMDDAPSYTYCMNDEEFYMISFFMIWYVTPRLLKDADALKSFREWLEPIMVTWAEKNNLKIEILRDKLNEYWLKFIIKIPVEMLNPKHTEHPTT